MLKGITFKKEYLLIAGGIILLVVSYQLAFRKTIEQWHLHHELEAKLVGVANMGYQPDYVYRKNANLNKIIRRFQADTALFRNNSVNTISLIAQHNGVRLVNVPVQDIAQDTGKVIVERLMLEGDYANLVKTADELSRNANSGWLRSMSLFTMRKNGSDDRVRQVDMELYLEIIK